MTDSGDSSRALALQGDTQALQAKLEEVRFSDYFAILGFHSEATLPTNAVENNYRALRQRFDPTRFVGVGMDDDVVAQLDELRRGLEDAYEVLSDPLLRERYRKGIR